MDAGILNISLNAAAGGITNNCKKNAGAFTCRNRFRLSCVHHGEDLFVRCGRWRTCPGCAAWKQWTIKSRLIAGIEEVPSGKLPMFFTLTFPASAAPTEDDAHKSWRSLVARLRYRGHLASYAWVLQRTRAGTLHYHGIAHLDWFEDSLQLWRELLLKSGFGVQNKLVIAERSHANYCAKYISRRFADLEPLRRAYGFSAAFPQSRAITARADLAAQYGIVPDNDCSWVPSYELR